MRKNNTKRRYALLFLATLIAGAILPGCHQSGCFLFSENDASRPFTLIVLPDTQNYTDSSFGGKPEYFYEQIQWIKENKDKLNIVMVAHVGDIVQNPQEDSNWKVADKAFRILDDEVPYIINVGNHDRYEKTDSTPKTYESLINTHFPATRFTRNPLYEAHFGPDKAAHYWPTGQSNNNYLFFTGGGATFLIISLEYSPSDATIDWANRVVAAHPHCQCIVVTHDYLNTKADFNNKTAHALWDKFIRRHKNIFLVLCGHVLGEALRANQGINGNQVFEVLSDYQNHYFDECGGCGYLRIMTFLPQKGRIEVRSYSPVQDKTLNRTKSQFDLQYDMKRFTGKDGP